MQQPGIGYGASAASKFSFTNGKKLIVPNERFEWLSVTSGFMNYGIIIFFQTLHFTKQASNLKGGNQRIKNIHRIDIPNIEVRNLFMYLLVDNFE